MKIKKQEITLLIEVMTQADLTLGQCEIGKMDCGRIRLRLQFRIRALQKTLKENHGKYI